MVQVWRRLAEIGQEDDGDMFGDWRLNADDCGEMMDGDESEKGESDDGASNWAETGVMVAGE